MTTDVDICNRALSEIGRNQLQITSMSGNSPAEKQCALQYEPMRQQLLRAAPWGFARKTMVLDTLGELEAIPPTSPYPWLRKYAYPTDCLKMRYLLPPPPTTDSDVAPVVGTVWLAPWCGPNRGWRYLPAYDPGDPDAEPDPIEPYKVILSNVVDALGVYTVDAINPDLWDSLFTDALVMALANKFVIPLSGNVAMKSSYVELAKRAVMEAQAVDGNEAVPSTDHTPDWIQARGMGGYGGMSGMTTFTQGLWYSGFDSMNWGM